MSVWGVRVAGADGGGTDLRAGGGAFGAGRAGGDGRGGRRRGTERARARSTGGAMTTGMKARGRVIALAMKLFNIDLAA